MSTIQIFLKGVRGKTTPLEIQEDSTTDLLFKIISMIEGVAVSDQRIIYAGKQLDSGKKICDYDIHQNSILYLVLRLLGGSSLTRKKYELEDEIVFTDDPDMITFEDSPDNPRTKMPCGHALTPDSLTSYCQSLLDQQYYYFKCCYLGNKDLPIHERISCIAIWPYLTVRKLAKLTPDEEKIFETKLSENYLHHAQEIQQCPGCFTYIERTDSQNKRVICSVCSKEKKETTEYCWSCLHPWKSNTKQCGNSECSGEDPRLIALRTAPQKTVVGVSIPSIRSCDKCGILIEHIVGCKHMKCVCGFEFCFICLKTKVFDRFPCGYHNSPCVAAPIQTNIVGL